MTSFRQSPNVSYGMNMYESTPLGTTMFPVDLPNMAITLTATGGFVIHDLMASPVTVSNVNTVYGIAPSAIVQGF